MIRKGITEGLAKPVIVAGLAIIFYVAGYQIAGLIGLLPVTMFFAGMLYSDFCDWTLERIG